MKVNSNRIEFAVARISRKATTLQDTQSGVLVTVPEGIEGSLWQKIHTNLSMFEEVVSDKKECIAGPVVELYLKS